jgi:hypothetical protein
MEADLGATKDGGAGDSSAGPADDDDVLDLGRIAGPAMLKRVAPKIIGTLIVLMVLRLVFRRSR